MNISDQDLLKTKLFLLALLWAAIVIWTAVKCCFNSSTNISNNIYKHNKIHNHIDYLS